MSLALVLIGNTNGQSIIFPYSLQKIMKNSYNKLIFNQYDIFHIYISFFILFSDLISITAKKTNQIRNNVVSAVAHLVFVYCCSLTAGRWNVFQHIFGNQNKSKFYGPYFKTMLFLVTMILEKRFQLTNIRTIQYRKP